MQIGVGVDLIAHDEVREAERRFGRRYLERVYTPAELADAAGSPTRLAECFAAKEAVLKALALPTDAPVIWREIEVSGPRVTLHGLMRASRPSATATVARSSARDQALAVAMIDRGEAHE